MVRRWICVLLCVAMLRAPVLAQPGQKYVALTFDDGPSGKYTLQLLEGLSQRGVLATFLLCGYRIGEYPDTAREIFARGHEVGLHGYTHKSMGAMSKQQILRELEKTWQALPPEYTPVFFRPPGGQVTAAARAAAGESGLAILNWSVDPRDWATRDADSVVQAVVADVADGDVILLHDMTSSSVAAALAIVDELQSQGFTFVTASQLAALRGVAPQPGKIYLHFRQT